MNHKIKQKLRIGKAAAKKLLLQKSNTCCYLLWDSVFIDQLGDVYHCCHSQPGVSGNIYKQDLLNIWNRGITLKIFRLMSLNKCLPCFDNCTILSKEQKQETKDGIMNSPSFNRKYPRRIWLLYGLACNLRCTMCPQDHRSRITIDNNVLKKNINWSEVEDIEFQGGEILAIKGAKEMYLWLTKEMNKKVNLVTNGTLINDEWAKHLVQGSNKIRISVNAATKRTHEFVNKGSKYEKVIDNIRKLIYYKHQLNLDTQITYHFTIVRDNIHEIADAIEVADSLGCGKIAYGYDSPVPAALREKKDLTEQIKSMICRLANSNFKIEIDTKRLQQLGLL